MKTSMFKRLLLLLGLVNSFFIRAGFKDDITSIELALKICANTRTLQTKNEVIIKPYTIEEGFVTFATHGYFTILEVLIKSVHAFSNRPIVVFGINDDVPFSTAVYPRLIKKRIDVNLKEFPIYYQKSRIIAESGIKHGIYVEADDIVNHNIDEIFAWCREVREYPLCPIHPNNCDIKHLPEILEGLGIKDKSMPYVHGHVVFSPACREFIKEWVSACFIYKDIASKQDYDETILNALLWKYNATKYLPIYDPYFTVWVDYIAGKDRRNPDWLYYMFHGAKDPQVANKILNDLINYAKRQ